MPRMKPASASTRMKRKVWLLRMLRNIEICRFYHKLGYGWREAWDRTLRTVN